MQSISRHDLDKTPNPLELINLYLGVRLDHKYRYICPHIEGDSFYIEWHKMSNDDKAHTDQVAFIQKLIELLAKTDTPLRPLFNQPGHSMHERGLTLCSGSYKDKEHNKAGMEVFGLDGFIVKMQVDDRLEKASAMTSVFYDRISEAVNHDATAVSYHRARLAWALEQHLAKNLLMQREEKHLVVNDTKLKKSVNRLHIPFQGHGSSSGEPGSPKKLSPGRKSSDSKELKHPLMPDLIQKELSKDIFVDLKFDRLMGDIQQSFDYIAIDHISLQSFPVSNILDIDISDLKNPEVKKFNEEVNQFYGLIERLLSKLGKPQQKDQEFILNAWRTCALEQWESNGFNNQSFIRAGENFFKHINKSEPIYRQVTALLVLLRQKMYVHPFDMMTSCGLQLKLQKTDRKRSTQFEFHENKVECRHFIRATIIQEKKLERECDFGLLTIMRSESSDLKSWSSEIRIQLNIIRGLKNKEDKIPKNIQECLIEPLKAVGFNIHINFIDAGFAKTS